MTPETEAKLDELAQCAHRSKDELLAEVLNCLVADNQWFEGQKKNRLGAAERGRTISDETVRACIEQVSGQTPNPDEDFRLVDIAAEPLSKTILRERR